METISLHEFMRIYGYTKKQLARIAHEEKYVTFYVPKRSGGKRRIEAPSKPLKKLQRIFGSLLDAWYLPQAPDCVHGYIADHPAIGGPRGIRTNAAAHLPNPYLLNLDLTDFFHSINEETLRQALLLLPQRPGRKFMNLLVDIVLKDGYLPMGAPTSPVLSNICAMQMDEELLTYCRQWNITYTRYADDMSFSAAYNFAIDHEADLIQIIESNGFTLNLDKRRAFPPESPRQVTGLNLVDGRIEVSNELKSSVTEHIEELNKLHWLNEALDGQLPNVKAKQKHYRQTIEGQLNFLRDIEGKADADYLRLNSAYEMAGNTRPPSFDFYFNSK